MTERDFALDVVRKLQGAGFEALWAGGCVRDELLGLTPADYDVATNARPEQLRPLFKRRNEIGASFGVVQVIGPRDDAGHWTTVEVATFRSDVSYSDGRRPDAVVFSSPEEDAKRRDFTINGMFFDPVKEKLVDYVCGRADLDAKVLRAIGDPAARFTEDRLRILRGVRIAARFELSIDPATLAAAKAMAHDIRVVSPERIAEELRKLLAHPNRSRGVRLLSEFGLVEPILPELAAIGAARWADAVRLVENLSQSASFPLAFAALLHALDRPAVEAIAGRLRLSGAEKALTAWLVEHQRSLDDAPTMSLSKLKTTLVQPGIDELLALHRARAVASGTSLGPIEFCEAMLRDTPPDELNPPPLVTGEDLKAMGLKPGPEFKRILDAVREAQLEGRVKTKEEAIEMARGLTSECEIRGHDPGKSGNPHDRND
jgi:poly(A) polymerase